MGGWYLQPDCNMPTGESFVRQILVGKNYFMDKFGVEPRTAINFDAFGHSRALVDATLRMLARHHGSYGVLARSWPTGSMVIWVALMLGLSLALYYT